MGYRTILVHCDSSDAAATRIAVARDLAGRSGARLVGLHVGVQFEPPFGFDSSAFSMEAFYLGYLEQVKADAEKSSASFHKGTDGQGLTVEWRAVEYTYGAVVEHARYADLIVVGQSNLEAPVAGVPANLPETVALLSGRPVLIIPHMEATGACGKTVMLCWNGSREAARAATEALPLLQAAQKVIVLTFASHPPLDDGDGQGTKNATAWLASHGVKSTVERDSANDADVGTQILSRAARLGADLIVMGAYGHSRMREMVLGGASRTILARATVPVLMAH